MSRLIVISVLIGLALFGLLSLSFAQEHLTITTYYPSPYGSYKDLAVFNQLYVGPIGDIFSPTGGSHPGAIAVSGSAAGLYLVNRNLISTTLSHPWGAGQVFYWYNLGGVAMLSNGATTAAGITNVLQVTSSGNLRASGSVRSNFSATYPSGCILMSYGSNSWTTTCPAGTHRGTGSMNTTASSAGGIFYCCS